MDKFTPSAITATFRQPPQVTRIMVFWELQARFSSDQRFLHNEGLCCLGYRCCITERVFEIFPRNCSYSNIPSPRLSLTGQIWVPEATGELGDIFSKALMCISTRSRRTEAGFDQRSDSIPRQLLETKLEN
jgi:hypothetical protein